MALANTTFGLFNNAANNAGQMWGSGLGMLGQGADWMSRAATGLMGAASGADSLAKTNLTPYTNPFQKQVIDATMGELDRRELMQRNQLKNEFQRNNAFGGDRMAVMEAENNRNFDQQRADTLARLNSDAFSSAMGLASSDLSRSSGAMSGLGQLGQSMSQIGQGQQQFGQLQLGGLAQQGFGMGQAMNDAQLRVGNQQQQQLQGILDAVMGQTNAWQNYGDTGLARYFGATQNPSGYGTTTTTGSTTSSSNPGIGGILGGLMQIGGLF